MKNIILSVLVTLSLCGTDLQAATDLVDNPYSCSSATKLGYHVKWSGAQNGATFSERGGKYWAFIGQGIRFYMQTRYRKSIGELIFYHQATDIDYTPDNEYQLQFDSKSSQKDYATLQLDDPWFEGMTFVDSGSVTFKTKTLRPTDEPCLEGHGNFTVRDSNNKSVNVQLVFALDVSGKKYRN
ncbi:MAG: hypothetical protein HWE27_13525 [Gammaproteobacteria bacterium]|nr:hypothetical protein [Gammaproteobacteria bacterium]